MRPQLRVFIMCFQRLKVKIVPNGTTRGSMSTTSPVTNGTTSPPSGNTASGNSRVEAINHSDREVTFIRANLNLVLM